jgi:hypothetical protein
VVNDSTSYLFATQVLLVAGIAAGVAGIIVN